MGLFSSGKKYKRAAERALRTANDIQDYQEQEEFRRSLISNIRQERIARAQLEVGNYSTTARSSSAEGALANIDSSLSGETYFSYASSDRAQRIQDLNEYAKRMLQKYTKQQKKRAAAFSITGMVTGAAIGGYLGGSQGALFGGSLGQGIGQIASNTGQIDTGISNIVKAGGQWIDNIYTAIRKNNLYQTTSIDATTNNQQMYYYSPIANKAVPLTRGYFS